MSLPFPSWERAFQPKKGCKIGHGRLHCYGAAETSVAETQRKEAGTDICFRTRFAHPSQDRSPPRGRGDRARFVALLRADSSVSPRWLRRASPRRLCCFSAPTLLRFSAATQHRAMVSRPVRPVCPVRPVFVRPVRPVFVLCAGFVQAAFPSRKGTELLP